MLWLEIDMYEPTSLRQIKDSTTTRICTGENLFYMRDFIPYFENHSADMFMIDVPWNGFSQSKKVGDLAEVYQHNVAPHNYYSHLSSFVSASLCATLPNVRIMEIDIDDIPWKDELTTTVPGNHRRLYDRTHRSRLGCRHQRRSSSSPPLGRKQPIGGADAGVQSAGAVGHAKMILILE